MGEASFYRVEEVGKVSMVVGMSKVSRRGQDVGGDQGDGMSRVSRRGQDVGGDQGDGMAMAWILYAFFLGL